MEPLHIPDFLVDQEGRWYADGVPMVQKKINTLFAEHLIKKADGSYMIDWQNQQYPVRVEDVPFLVTGISMEEGQPMPMLQLFDGRKLPMPPGHILLKNDIPYLTLTWPGDTKISQPVYERLIETLSERDGSYFIQYGGREWQLEELA